MRAYERLIKYAKVSTASDPDSGKHPSSERQFDLAHLLVDELKELGIDNAQLDDKCYVYASIPASEGCENAPAIGLIAHVDTSPDFSGEGVNPIIIENYDGEDVVLGDSGRVLRTSQFPHLKNLKGRTLIVTDGTTLLGSDDKSGIAEIMTAAERILTENIPHGKICIGFTPDEEIGGGTDYFDIERFGADFAYTLDGSLEGEIEFENFNAAAAEITVHGFNVHPGEAKDRMINAALVAMEFNNMLPAAEIPARTEGYEGFFHLTEMDGSNEIAHLSYIIRDHSKVRFETRKEQMQLITKALNERWGEGTVTLQIRDQYYNMEEMIRPHFHLVENALAAAEEAGMKPLTRPERGGTDGAMLSYKGLPCPNLGTGGYAFHGPYEHVTVEGMDLSVELILGILRRYAAAGKE